MDNLIKQEMINFINDRVVDVNNELTLLTPDNELRTKLEEVITLREQELTEDGIYPDDWGDDEIIEQAQDYINLLLDDMPTDDLVSDVSVTPARGGKKRKSSKKRKSKRKSKRRSSKKNKRRTSKKRKNR